MIKYCSFGILKSCLIKCLIFVNVLMFLVLECELYVGWIRLVCEWMFDSWVIWDCYGWFVYLLYFENY